MIQTLGQRLKQTREDQRLTLDKVSEATRIRVPYLQALEADDHSSLPSPVQARGFLRNYAEFLGLDLDQVLEEIRAQQAPVAEVIGPADEQLTDSPATPPSPSRPDSATQTEANAEAVPEPTRRRGRKKSEPVGESVREEQPASVVESEPSVGDQPVEEIASQAQEEQSAAQTNVNDSLWQTWLNRIVPARKKDAPPAEVVSAEAEVTEATLPEPEEQPAPIEDTESNRIFKEVGDELRKRRELLSLHLDEVERNTHVKAHYLEALEKGVMDDLPSTVQTRGMLSNYATFLDLDVDALLLRYADALQARHREKNPQKTARRPGQPILSNMPPIRSFIAGDVIFGLGMAMLLIGFMVWSINQVLALQSQREAEPTAMSISDVLLATPDGSEFTATPSLLPANETLEATQTIVIPTQNLNVDVQVNLVAVERTYMRVVVDGAEVFNGRVVPGTAYPFEAEEQIEILVGSGAAIRVVYNGRDLGLLGGLGQIVSVIYLENEIITPTAQPTPSPTETPPFTATVPVTLTPVPTSTPVP